MDKQHAQILDGRHLSQPVPATVRWWMLVGETAGGFVGLAAGVPLGVFLGAPPDGASGSGSSAELARGS